MAAASWRAAGFAVPVAVNVSPRSLLDSNFPKMVIGRLAARALPADVLIVELTESLTLSQLEIVDEVLGALREAGIMLALDDFGTGYSSLATLARVPVNELKIDRTFVDAMDSTQADAAVVRSTCSRIVMSSDGTTFASSARISRTSAGASAAGLCAVLICKAVVAEKFWRSAT